MGRTGVSWTSPRTTCAPCRIPRLSHADAVDHLGTATPYDVTCSLSTFHFLDPHRLLPALATALKPGGRLCFTVLHTNSGGDGPASTVTPRPEILRLDLPIEHKPARFTPVTP